MEFKDLLFEYLQGIAHKRAVDYRTNVVPWIKEVLEAGGIPQFRTRYGSHEFDGMVLGVAWGTYGMVGSKWFKNVPEEDLVRMAAATGDYKWILQKYGGGHTGGTRGRVYVEYSVEPSDHGVRWAVYRPDGRLYDEGVADNMEMAMALIRHHVEDLRKEIYGG